MIQGRCGIGFQLEAVQALRIGRERCRQDLDGHVAFEPRIARAIHLAHAAGADGGHDLVRSKAGFAPKRHSSRRRL